MRFRGRGALPNLLVIGAAKGGTTSLHYYLSLHPDIQMAREKELHFFSDEACWAKGPDWYRSHFDPRYPVRGESSVSYTFFPRRLGVPERIRSVVPEAKLIYILRDPIERLVSAYVHRYSEQKEHRPLEEALRELEGNSLVEGSSYFFQLQQFVPFFPPAQILILVLEELRADRRRVLSEVFEFLGVDSSFDSPGFDVIKHRSRFKRRKGRIGMALWRFSHTRVARVLPPDARREIGKVLYRPFSKEIEPPRMSDATRARLRECLLPDVERLRAHTGKAFSEWSL